MSLLVRSFCFKLACTSGHGRPLQSRNLISAIALPSFLVFCHSAKLTVASHFLALDFAVSFAFFASCFGVDWIDRSLLRTALLVIKALAGVVSLLLMFFLSMLGAAVPEFTMMFSLTALIQRICRPCMDCGGVEVMGSRWLDLKVRSRIRRTGNSRSATNRAREYSVSNRSGVQPLGFPLWNWKKRH